MRLKGGLILGGLLVVFLPFVGAGQSLDSGQCPEVQFYELLPPSWPCPVLPTCGTEYGVCRLPANVRPGQPCSCRAANGTWIPGVCTRGL